MKNIDAVISIKVDEATLKSVFQQAILENERSAQDNSFLFDIYQDDDSRGVLDNEWLMFSLMIIPAIESTINIAELIKNVITQKTAKKLQTLKVEKKIKTKVKISIPFLSYENEEDIIIDSTKT